MQRCSTTIVILTLVAAWMTRPACSQVPGREFVNTYCLDCHQGSFAEADLHLDQLASDLSDVHSFRDWSQVFERVSSGAMPPEDFPQPKEEDRQIFLRTLNSALTSADTDRQHSQGRAALRRLNRLEYQNTLRDVLAMPHLDLLDILPPDGTHKGFDKSSDALDVSAVHIQKWLTAVDQALRQSVAPTEKKPDSRTIRVELKGLDNTRANMAFYHSLKHGRAIPMVGLDVDPTLSSRAGDFAKKDAGEVTDPPPHFDGVAMFSSGVSNLDYTIRPFKVSVPGIYKIRVHGFSLRDEYGELTPLNEAQTVGFYTDSRKLGYCELPPYEPATAELEVWLEPGERIKPLVASSTYPSIRVGNKRAKDGHTWQKELIGNGIVYQWFELEGPIYKNWPPESHKRLFGDLPINSVTNEEEQPHSAKDSSALAVEVVSENPKQDARRLIEKFAKRAIRRPITQTDLEVPLQIASEKLDDGVPLTESLLAAYRSILCSPDVVLLNEPVGKLDDHALAARLSYFLWASPPDAELLRLADSHQLQDEQVLRQQVERMLAAEKSRRFRNHFLDHWLDLKDVHLTVPDVSLYPEFSPFLADSMLAESRAYFHEMIRHDLGVEHLVASDFLMLNGSLAKLYDVEGVAGNEIRRVPLKERSPRGGFLAQAAVLKVTANGTTTSPVTRGVFVMDRLLGDPLPPPPASVPAIDPDLSGATTIRQQLSAHRELSECAACHRKIDPPGFALECFDVMGGYRQRYRSLGEGELIEDLFVYGGVPAGVRLAQSVDSSGELTDGGQFDDIHGFRAALRNRQPQLADNMLRRLITYATGAEPTYADQREIDRMLDSLAENNYGVRSMIHKVVQSRLFREK